MTVKTRNQIRSLIVVSRNQEEFDLAMYFLRGQKLASEAVIALPDDLYADNKDSVPVSAFPYGKREDILGAVDTHKPDLVLLLSAYLFSLDGLLSPASLDTLLHELRDRGCRVMTSDPFLGLAPQLTRAQIDTRMLAPGQPALHRWLIRLVLRLQGSRAKLVKVPDLEDVPHVYPTSIPDCDDRIARLSFFNPTIIRAAPAAQVAGDGRDHGEPHDTQRRWLFVLSATDLHCQRVRMGLSEFTELLLGLLRHTVEAERHPTLIAPSSIVERLGNALPDSVELLSFCPFAEFEKRIVDAEYVFYWNAFSFSQLVRLANELPVFVFDRGYYAQTIKPYYEIASSCHLGGWEPKYLDQRQLFSPYVLAHLAKAQKPAMRALRERWQSSPTPDELVDRLLR